MGFPKKGTPMDVKQAFGSALKLTRKAKGLTQEDFSQISSRTYISTLERGLYVPTIDKVDTIAKFMGVHPVTLFALSYLSKANSTDQTVLLDQVKEELEELLKN